MEEYKPNSYKSKEERKVETVISGTAKTKKKNDIQKFANVFISEDISNVKSFIIMDVLVPAVKKIISDTVDTILYGEGGRRDRKKYPTSNVSYRGFYERENERKHNYNSAVKNGYDYDDVAFETRGDAESVLDAMNDIIAQYGVVSVGDLYDLSNVSTDNYAANKYGWTDISGCKAVRTRHGDFILKLPRALPLN